MSMPGECRACTVTQIVILLLVLLLFIASLVGCSTAAPSPSSAAPLPTFHPPMAPPAELQKVRWTVLTKERIGLIKDDSVYVALTWDEYLRLSQNMAEIESYLRSQGAVLCYYRVELREKRCVVPLIDPNK